MPTIISRQEWGAAAAESRTPWQPDDLLGVCVHHFAIPRSAASASGSDELMRGVQRSHMAGEFSDIAYNHCFDKFGQIFEGRGFNFQTGANGTTAANRTHAAICFMGDSDKDGFPEKAQDAAAWLLKQWFERGAGIQVIPHRQFTGSGCPGNKAHDWVVSGAWKKDLPETRRIRWMVIDDGKIVDRSGPMDPVESKERGKAYFNNQWDRMYRRIVAEGKTGDVRLARKVSLG